MTHTVTTSRGASPTERRHAVQTAQRQAVPNYLRQGRCATPLVPVSHPETQSKKRKKKKRDTPLWWQNVAAGRAHLSIPPATTVGHNNSSVRSQPHPEHTAHSPSTRTRAIGKQQRGAATAEVTEGNK
ncbi:hypothetical protein LSM04_005578 [Trypanosoma melophagium]|uniref:uncharacterized protein n=1 Tax=Trypanosoma melophagium TaxID=715481 RepID=UPI003519DA75|nr:hypothetical protein LSM04_005578 [Trypanosoma melophagium]